MENSIGSIASIGNLSNSKLDSVKKVAGNGFSNVLQTSISDLNQLQQQSDKAMADIATGEVKNLHQAALAIDKAETSMKMMLEIRNKALSAYKEISRTQI